MSNPVHDLISTRASASHLRPGTQVSRQVIECVIALATRAPTSYNLQNWRFVIADTPAAKEKLRAVAYNQNKITDAAAVVILIGTMPDPERLKLDLGRAVAAGLLPHGLDTAWAASVRAKYGDDPQASRDEAIRSASLAAATLMIAAEAEGLATCPMIGFDAAGVAREFGLASEEIPVMLVAIGKASEDSWPQKPRRAVSEVLSYA